MCKRFEIVGNRAGANNNSARIAQRADDAPCVPTNRVLTAMMSVGYGDQVMDHVDRPQICTTDPLGMTFQIEIRVADIQIDAAMTKPGQPRFQKAA
ncbi:hypothetical protein A8V01_04450 [Novosphingobium guangzhouense]|uniref:Uncharacterized protein n=1 Tax=Novosphingobium guangzhouense TaxID=1850347 RepID=A0A2K2G205_9SPHN|nr:hypothetical protein A8V01_04450 [Novosphingobium guangzhouense]